jgi:hypothetical protein
VPIGSLLEAPPLANPPPASGSTPKPPPNAANKSSPNPHTSSGATRTPNPYRNAALNPGPFRIQQLERIRGQTTIHEIFDSSASCVINLIAHNAATDQTKLAHTVGVSTTSTLLPALRFERCSTKVSTRQSGVAPEERNATQEASRWEVNAGATG